MHFYVVVAPPFSDLGNSKAWVVESRRCLPRTEPSLRGRDEDLTLGRGTVIYDVERNTKIQLHLASLADSESQHERHK